MKNKLLIFIIGIFLLIGIILLILFGVFQSVFLNVPTTAYINVAYDKDKITYSNLDSFTSSQNGFTSLHILTETSANYFEFGVDNKGLFAPYLEYNGIDSSQFTAGGVKPLVCVFSPNSGNPYSAELIALGFVYLNNDETHQEYSVGASYQGVPCNQCITSGCSSIVNRGCEAFKTNVVVKKTPCWTGNYQNSKLNEIANKMICEVSGTVNQLCSGSPLGSSDRCVSYQQSFIVQGIGDYHSGKGFVCQVNVDYLRNKLPITMIQPSDGRNVSIGKIGFDGIVTFRKANQITIYRLENKVCNSYSILENQKLSSDYLTMSECQNQIIPVPTKPTPGGFAKFWNSIADFFRNLFGIR